MCCHRPGHVLLRGYRVRPEDLADGGADLHRAAHGGAGRDGVHLRVRELAGVRALEAAPGRRGLVALPPGEKEERAGRGSIGKQQCLHCTRGRFCILFKSFDRGGLTGRGRWVCEIDCFNGVCLGVARLLSRSHRWLLRRRRPVRKARAQVQRLFVSVSSCGVLCAMAFDDSA